MLQGLPPPVLANMLPSDPASPLGGACPIGPANQHFPHSGLPQDCPLDGHLTRLGK